MDRNASIRAAWLGLLAALSISLSACAPGNLWNMLSGRGEPVPDEPGLYALIDGGHGGPSLQRLDGPRQWEIDTWPARSQLSPDVAFVVRHPELARSHRQFGDAVRLRRVAWVRSTINARGDVLPVDGSRWAAPDLDVFEVPLRVEAYQGRDDIVRATPLAALEPGLYSLEINAGGQPTRARIGVQWASVDERAYSAATCVDRYESAGPRYRPCAAQTQQTPLPTAAQWLRLYLVAPEFHDRAAGRNLVIRGVVVNVSDDAHVTVPQLEAQVRAAAGHVLQRWRFDPGIGELAPGASASFRTESRDTPPEAHSVHVEIAGL